MKSALVVSDNMFTHPPLLPSPSISVFFVSYRGQGRGGLYKLSDCLSPCLFVESKVALRKQITADPGKLDCLSRRHQYSCFEGDKECLKHCSGVKESYTGAASSLATTQLINVTTTRLHMKKKRKKFTL